MRQITANLGIAILIGAAIASALTDNNPLVLVPTGIGLGLLSVSSL